MLHSSMETLRGQSDIIATHFMCLNNDITCLTLFLCPQLKHLVGSPHGA